MTILSDLTSKKTNPSPPCLITSASTSRVAVREGDDAFLQVLKGPGSGPILDVFWAKGSRQLAGERYRIGENNNAVHLTLQGITREDEGEYTVTAKNIAGESRSAVYLRIKDGPYDEDDAPIFLRRLNDLAVKVGTRTRFLVEIRSSSDVKVIWNRNDVPISEEDRFHYLHEGNFFCVDVAPVTVEDGGRWSCVAENRTGRSSCSSRLNVLVPKAYKAPEFLEELKAVLTDQGTVSLECKVVGIPTPVLKWYKDKKEIKPGDMFALTANQDDPTSLGMYTCEAINCMGKAYSSSRVHVSGRGSREGSVLFPDAHFAIGTPPQFKKELKNEKVKIGSSLLLMCQVAVPPWPKSINWYNKQGKVEPSEKYHIMEDGLGGYSIEIFPLDTSDEGEWKCVATSDTGVISITKCDISMTYPKNYRKPKFLESLKAILTEEGLVSFECKVVGFPTPRLQWFKDGQELRPGDVYQLTGTNSLGSYSCVARNCMGEAKSSAELTVEDIQSQLNEEERLHLFSKNQPPRFIRGLKSCEAKINEDFRYTVQVTLSPEVNLSWYRDDEVIENSERYSLVKESTGVCHLDIKKLEVNDQAEWKCVASNDFGQSITTGFLKLTIPKHYKKPKFLECLRAILSEEGAVNLECKVIGVPQPVLKWYKDGKELKPGDIHRIVSGQDGKCCLGTYTCEARNCMGTASSSASLLGFEDRKAIKEIPKSVPEPLYQLAKNTSLSTIHEERTSQLYDTPGGEQSITMDERGDFSFSFDGKEVSISLYETPDLTEEEALQVVEMYAEELSEHISEQNVVELPPMRFTKESSKSGPLLMEAVVIDVSEDYFSTAEDDLRTEADFEDVSMAEEGPQILPALDIENETFFEKITSDYLEKALAPLSGHDQQPVKRRSSTDSKDRSDSFKSFSSPKKGSVKGTHSDMVTAEDDSKGLGLGNARGSSDGSNASLIKEEKTRKKKSRSSSVDRKNRSFEEKVEEGVVTITPKRTSVSRSSSGGFDDKPARKKTPKSRSQSQEADEKASKKRSSRSASDSLDETIVDSKKISRARSQSGDSGGNENAASTKKKKKKTEGARSKSTSQDDVRKSLSRQSSVDHQKKRKASSEDSLGKQEEIIIKKSTSSLDSERSAAENATPKKKKIRSRSSSIDQSKEGKEKRKSAEKVIKKIGAIKGNEEEIPIPDSGESPTSQKESKTVEGSLKEILNTLETFKQHIMGNDKENLKNELISESFQELEQGLEVVGEQVKSEDVPVLQDTAQSLQDFKVGLNFAVEQKTPQEAWQTFSLVTKNLQEQLQVATVKVSEGSAKLAAAITSLMKPIEKVGNYLSEVTTPESIESLSPVEILQNLAQPVQELQEALEAAKKRDIQKSDLLLTLAKPMKDLQSVVSFVEQKAQLEIDEEDSISEKILKKVSNPVEEISEGLKAIENQTSMEQKIIIPEGEKILEKMSRSMHELQRGLAEVVQEVLFSPPKEEQYAVVLRNLVQSISEVLANLKQKNSEEAPTQEQRRILFSSLETPLTDLNDSLAVVKEILTLENLDQVPPEVIKSNVMKIIEKPLRDLEKSLGDIKTDLNRTPDTTQVNKENICQVLKNMKEGVVRLRESEQPITEVFTFLLSPLQELKTNLIEKKTVKYPLTKSSSSLGKSLDLIHQGSEDDKGESEEMKINLSVLRPLEKPLQDLEEGFSLLEHHILQKELSKQQKPSIEGKLQKLLEILSQSFEAFQEKWVTIEANKEGEASLLEANALLELIKELKNGSETIQGHLIQLESNSPDMKDLIEAKVSSNLNKLKISIVQVENMIMHESLEVIPEFKNLIESIVKIKNNLSIVGTQVPQSNKVFEILVEPIMDIQENLENITLREITDSSKPVLDEVVSKTFKIFKEKLNEAEQSLAREETVESPVRQQFKELKNKVEEQLNKNSTVESLPQITRLLEKFGQEMRGIDSDAVQEVLALLDIAVIDLSQLHHLEMVNPLIEPLTNFRATLQKIKEKGMADQSSFNVLKNLIKPLNDLNKGLKNVSMASATDSIEISILFDLINNFRTGISGVQQQISLHIDDDGVPEQTHLKDLKTLISPLHKLQESILEAQMAQTSYGPIVQEISSLKDENLFFEEDTKNEKGVAKESLQAQRAENIPIATAKVENQMENASTNQKKASFKPETKEENVGQEIKVKLPIKKDDGTTSLESVVKKLKEGLENVVETFKDERHNLVLLTVPLYDLGKALEKVETEKDLIDSENVNKSLVELLQNLQELEQKDATLKVLLQSIPEIKNNAKTFEQVIASKETTDIVPEERELLKTLNAVFHELQEAVEITEDFPLSEVTSLALDKSVVEGLAKPIENIQHILAEINEYCQLEKEKSFTSPALKTLAKPVQKLQDSVAVFQQQIMETASLTSPVILEQISKPALELSKGIAQIQQQLVLISEKGADEGVKLTAKLIQEVAMEIATVQEQISMEPQAISVSSKSDVSVLKTLAKPALELEKIIALVHESQFIEPEAKSLAPFRDSTFAEPLENLLNELQQLQNVILEGATVAECIPILTAVAKPVRELHHSFAIMQSHEFTKDEASAPIADFQIMEKLASPVQELASGILVVQQQLAECGVTTLSQSFPEPSSLLSTFVKPEELQKIIATVQQCQLIEPTPESISSARESTLAQPLYSLKQGLNQLQTLILESATLEESLPTIRAIAKPVHELETCIAAMQCHEHFVEEAVESTRVADIITKLATPIQELASGLVTIEQQLVESDVKSLPGIEMTRIHTEKMEGPLEKLIVQEQMILDAEGNTLSQFTNFEEATLRTSTVKEISSLQGEIVQQNKELKILESIPAAVESPTSEYTETLSEVESLSKYEEESSPKEGLNQTTNMEASGGKKDYKTISAEIQGEKQNLTHMEENFESEIKRENEPISEANLNVPSKSKNGTELIIKMQDEHKPDTNRKKDESPNTPEIEQTNSLKVDEQRKQKKAEDINQDTIQIKAEQSEDKKLTEIDYSKKTNDTPQLKQESQEKGDKNIEKEKPVFDDNKTHDVELQKERDRIKTEENKNRKDDEKIQTDENEKEANRMKQEEEIKDKNEETRKKEEEAKKLKAEEEAKKLKAEEEAKKKKQGEEEAKKLKTEEETKKKKEEQAKKKKEEEEEAKKQKEDEEGTKKQQEEKEAQKKEQEAKKKKDEEEETKKKKEEEEAKKLKAEEDAKKKKEEEEAKKKKQEEEEAKKKKEEEEAKKLKTEEEAKKKKEEEETKKKKEEEEAKKLKAEEETKKKKQEEEEVKKKKQEEEAKKKKQEEEEAKKKKEEEEAKKKKEEEEETKKLKAEEEAKKKEQEAKKKKVEEEEATKLKAEEQAKKLKAEEEAKKKEQEAKKKKEEEEAKKKKEEEEAKKLKAEEEAKKKKQEEEEAKKKKQEEEEAKKKKEEEEAKKLKAEEEAKKKKQEEEEAKKKKQEEEEAKKKKEEEEAKKLKAEEEAKKKKEEEAKKKKEEEETKKKKEEEETKKKKEEEETKKKKEEEEAKKKKEEEEAKKLKAEEEAKKKKEEEEAKKLKAEEEAKKKEEETKKKKEEEEAKKKKQEEEEAKKKKQEEEEAKKKKQEEEEAKKKKQEEEEAKKKKEEEEAKKLKAEEEAKKKKQEEEEAKKKKQEEEKAKKKEEEEAKKLKAEEEAKKKEEEEAKKKKEEEAKKKKEEEEAKKLKAEEEAKEKKEEEETKKLKTGEEAKKKNDEDAGEKKGEAKEKKKEEEGEGNEAVERVRKREKVKGKSKVEESIENETLLMEPEEEYGKFGIKDDKRNIEEQVQKSYSSSLGKVKGSLEQDAKMKSKTDIAGIEDKLEKENQKRVEFHRVEKREGIGLGGLEETRRRRDISAKRPMDKFDSFLETVTETSAKEAEANTESFNYGKSEYKFDTHTNIYSKREKAQTRSGTTTYQAFLPSTESIHSRKFTATDAEGKYRFESEGGSNYSSRADRYLGKPLWHALHKANYGSSLVDISSYRQQKKMRDIKRIDVKKTHSASLDDLSLTFSSSEYYPRQGREISREKKGRPMFCSRLVDCTAPRGTNIKLTCTVLGNPEPEVKWLKDGLPFFIKSGDRYKAKTQDGFVTLEIEGATQLDNGKYTCLAVNDHGEESTSCKLKIFEGYDPAPFPPTFTTSLKDTYKFTEDKLILQCRVRSHPPPKVQWLRNGVPIRAGNRYQQTETFDGGCQLIIFNPEVEDSGDYTCKAENQVAEDSITRKVKFLGRSHYANERKSVARSPKDFRKPHFRSELSDYIVPSGGTIALQVEVRGTPIPEVKWLRGKEELPRSSSKVRFFEDEGVHTLIVSNASESEAGIYSCHAYNAFGHIRTTAAVEVLPMTTVRGGKPPKIVNRPKDIMAANVNDDVIITCRITGDPKPRVSWMKGTKDITITQRTMVDHTDDYYRFTMKKVVAADAGTYWIIAKNVHGHDRAFVTLQVKERARSLSPGGFSFSKWDWTAPPTDSLQILSLIHDREKYNKRETPGPIGSEPYVAESGRNRLTLSWNKPSNIGGAPVIAYRVDAWELGQDGGARWTELGITPVNTFDAFNLKQGKQYKFRITPRNRYGWGEPLVTSCPVNVGYESIHMPEFTKILPGQLKGLLGSSIGLECHVSSDTRPQINWYRDGIPVDFTCSRLTHSFEGSVCRLVISNLVESDSGRYMCEAINKIGRVSTFARLMIVSDPKVWEADARLKWGVFDEDGIKPDSPPQFTMRLRDRRVQMTYPVRLTCQIIGSPAPQLKWYHDGEEIAQDDRHTFSSEDHFHTLEMSKAMLEDAGCYMATAWNDNGSVSCRCNLVVDKGIRAYIAPEFVHELEVTKAVRIGNELRLIAQVEAYPSVGIVWHRNGVRLRPSRRIIMNLSHDGTIELVIAQVTERDSGVYICTAANEVGRCESVCRVNVQSGTSDTIPQIRDSSLPYSKPPMFLKKPRSNEAVEGETVIIECQVIGDPTPEVFWLRDFLKPDYYRDAPSFRREGEGPDYRLEIAHAKLDHTGTYSVVARNVHGEVKAVTSLQIYAKGQGKEDTMDNNFVPRGRVETLPRFIKGLKDIRCCDGDAVTLECMVEATGPLEVTWKKAGKLVRLGGDFAAEFDGTVAKLKINQVYPEDEGEYTCEVSNNLIKISTSACLVVDVPEGKENLLSSQLHRPSGLMSSCSTPRSTPRTTPTRSVSPYPPGFRYRSTSPGNRPKRLKVTPPKFYAVPHNRIVQEGESVRFQCSVGGHPAPWVTWDKDGLTVTPTARITMSEKEDLKILEISEVTPEDAGLYRIVVENEVGRIEATAKLDVIGPHSYKSRVGNPRVWSSSPTFRKRLVRSVGRIGENITLSCDIRSSPNPVTSWYRNGEYIVRTGKFTPTWDGKTAELEIENLKKEDAGLYTCVAENEFGSSQCSALLAVENEDNTLQKAPVLSQLLDDASIEEGNPAEFLIHVQGDGPIDVVWFKDNKQIPDCNDFRYVDYGDGRYGLRIADAFPEDSGEYSCEVYNQYGYVTSSARLWVRDNAANTTPKLIFSKKPTSAVVASGGSVSFCCRVQPSTSSLPVVISWFATGRIVSKNSSGRYLIEEDGDVSILHITSVDQGDAGQIVCTASYECPLCSEGKCICSNSSVSCAAELTVLSDNWASDSECIPFKCRVKRSRSLSTGEIKADLPKMSKDNTGYSVAKQSTSRALILRGPIDQNVFRGVTVVLSAAYCGQPEPNVRWMKGGQRLENCERIQIKTENGVTSLTIDAITSDDSGKYVVLVENDHGSDRHFASLAVEGPPEPPSVHPTVDGLSSDSARVEWTSPAFDGGCKIIAYVIEMKSNSEPHWKVVSTVRDSFSHIVRNLKPNEKYKFRVRAENVHGCSEPSSESNELNLNDVRYEFPQFETKKVTIEDGNLFKARFEVQEELGKGRFGIVHKVSDVETGQKLAAKFIRCITVRDREKVKEEIEIMNCLRHPKLLQLAAAFESPREIVMVTEYISGGELFERVVADDFQLTERDCILFMRQICEGVRYMHENSVVHLDLKPENIMCQTRISHEIKLIDFGLAQKIDPDNPIRVLFGTPEFVPPEVINYEPIGFESDMWSVGVICYVLLSGLSPFMGENDAETFANITRASYDFDEEAFSTISQDAKDFISALLVKRKEKRLTASQCLRNKWMLSEHDKTMGVILSTDKLKKFIIRRKWQKTGNAIRALGRLATLSAASRKNSSSNSRQPISNNSNVKEESQQSLDACENTSSPSASASSVKTNADCRKSPVNSIDDLRSKIFSERRDSGISDCSSLSAGHNSSIPPFKLKINTEIAEASKDARAEDQKFASPQTIEGKVDAIRKKFANLSKNIDEMDKKLETVGRKLVDIGPGKLSQSSRPEIKRVPSLKESKPPDIKRLMQPTASSQAKVNISKSPVLNRKENTVGLTVPVSPDLKTAKLSRMRQGINDFENSKPNSYVSPTVKRKRFEGLKTPSGTEQRTLLAGERSEEASLSGEDFRSSLKKGASIKKDFIVPAKESSNIRSGSLNFQKAVAFWKR